MAHYMQYPQQELAAPWEKMGLEASTIGLAVGVWPQSIVLNQTLVFIREKQMLERGEFGGYYYVERGGTRKLLVFND
jgi:hypothetical protein